MTLTLHAIPQDTDLLDIELDAVPMLEKPSELGAAPVAYVMLAAAISLLTLILSRDLLNGRSRVDRAAATCPVYAIGWRRIG